MKKKPGIVTGAERLEQSKADKANWRRKVKQPKKLKTPKPPIQPRTGYSEIGVWDKAKLAQLLATYEKYDFPDGSGSKFTPNPRKDGKTPVVQFEFSKGRVFGYSPDDGYWRQEYDAEFQPKEEVKVEKTWEEEWYEKNKDSF